MARQPPAFTDATWRLIVAAAEPMKPDEVARAAVDGCIQDFVGQHPPATIVAFRDAWREATKHLAEAGDALVRLRRVTPHDPDNPDDDLQHDIRAVRQAQSRAERRVERLDIEAREYQGQRAARAVLLRRLMEIWCDHFGGKLTVTVPGEGGAPRGPLILWLTAVLDAIGEPTNSYTLRAAIERESRRLANAKSDPRNF